MHLTRFIVACSSVQRELNRVPQGGETVWASLAAQPLALPSTIELWDQHRLLSVLGTAQFHTPHLWANKTSNNVWRGASGSNPV
jgi:hypothetical protein